MESNTEREIGFFSCLRFVYIVINNIALAFFYLTWMILLSPLHYLEPQLYLDIEGVMFKWLMGTVGNWIWELGHRIEEMGDDITSLHEDEVLFLPNHIATGDVGLIMAILYKHGPVTERMMWIAYIIFKYTHFGVVSLVHGDFFIDVGKETLIYLKKHLKSSYKTRDRKWIVLFPEGTFLRKGKASSQRYAKKMNLPVLENVSLPRMGALQTILDTQNIETDSPDKTIKYILDVTIGYPGQMPLDMKNVCFGTLPPRKVSVLYRLFPISEVPMEPTELEKWMIKLYDEKDKMLDTFYKTGEFPEVPDSRRSKSVSRMQKSTLIYDMPKQYFIQCVILISCNFQWMVLKEICCWFIWVLCLLLGF